MKDLLTPDRMFPDYRSVTPGFLLENNIHALLIDIDNTLAPYEQPDPDPAILSWFEALRESGIRAVLISNNHADRVGRFNRAIGVPAYPDAGKPGSKIYKTVLQELALPPEEVSALGDQLLTDAWGAKRLGMRAIILPPIKDKTNLFFRFKRFLERPYIRRYARLHGYEPFMAFWKIHDK